MPFGARLPALAAGFDSPRAGFLTHKSGDAAGLHIAEVAGATVTQVTFARTPGPVTAAAAAGPPAISTAREAAGVAAISPAGGANQKPGPVS